MMRLVPRSLLAGSGIRSLPAPRVAVAAFHCSPRRRALVSLAETRGSLPSRILPARYPPRQPQQLRTIATTAVNLQQQEDSAEMAEPTGLIAKSGIELLTFGTPNGVKASILLEELKQAYGTAYTFQSINISKNTQKEPWYTALNPNGRIPTIVDHNRGGFPVFEGLAILTYLARHYDVDHKFSFPVDSYDYSIAEQWIAWQHGGLGPMQGQANHFLRAAPEKLGYAVQRYVGEVERLYGILDKRLEGREYVAGEGSGRYSIADIALVGWVNGSRFAGIDLPGQFPNVQAWLGRVLERPAVQRGLAVPGGSVSRFSNASLKEGMWEEGRKMVEEGDRLIKEAKEKYGYKYASP